MSLFSTASVMAGTITGTAHDLSGGTQQICVFCHTPHNSDTSVGDAPLWNHTVTTTAFTMYPAGNLDAAQDAQPTGTSKLCLSCHDGVTAIDSYGNNTALNAMTNLSAAVGAGGNLTDDHPISITYDTALSSTDPGLHDPATRSVIIGEGGDKTRNGTVAALLLSDGKVQCTSCHDVHNNFVGIGTNDEPFLKVSKGNSKLCLTCHNK